MLRTVVLSGAAILAMSAGAAADTGVSTRVVVDEHGQRMLSGAGPAGVITVGSERGGSTWSYPDSAAIAESVALSGAAARAWVAQGLNFERLQTFEIPGDATPEWELPMTGTNASITHAAEGADRAVYLYDNGSNFIFSGFTSASSTPDWTFNAPAAFNNTGFQAAKVSRDGSKAALVVYNGAANAWRMYIFDASTGEVLNEVDGAGFANGVDLTDDGSLALVTCSNIGRVIDTETGAEVFSSAASGGGGWFQISGGGETLVLGGFDLRVFKRSGGTYTSAFTFSAPNSWFGSASAVSRDGATVGVLSHNYADGYLTRTARLFDVSTGALLGAHTFTGSGGNQGSASGAVLSDNGSVFAVSHWGTADGGTPEVLVFDRDVKIIGVIDTPGSVFSLDMTGDGRFVLAGSKSIHANTNGNGGRVDLLDLGVACAADFNGNGTLDVGDFTAFRNAYLAGDMAADFNGNGSLEVGDFTAFRNAYLAGCP